MKRVDFLENASFKSYGDICWSSRSSSLLDELSVYRRDSDDFFSTRVAYRSSYSSHNSTDSSLYSSTGSVLVEQKLLGFYVRYLETIRGAKREVYGACIQARDRLRATVWRVHCKCFIDLSKNVAFLSTDPIFTNFAVEWHTTKMK